MSRFLRCTLGVTAIVITLALATSARAQQPPPPEFASHEGFMIGFGVGGSYATCEDCDGESAFGFDFNVGGFMNPRLAIMYDVSSWLDSQDGATLALACNAVAAQYWVGPSIWVKGGAGLSQARFSFNGGSDSDYGFGVTGAAGFEVMQNGNFALDLSGRLNLLDFDGISFQTLNFVVGARWK